MENAAERLVLLLSKIYQSNNFATTRTRCHVEGKTSTKVQ